LKDILLSPNEQSSHMSWRYKAGNAMMKRGESRISFNAPTITLWATFMLMSSAPEDSTRPETPKCPAASVSQPMGHSHGRNHSVLDEM
jgi:hypothetical protein